MARGDADDFAVAVLDFGLGSDTVAPFAPDFHAKLRR
jgi:hypothetical protein